MERVYVFFDGQNVFYGAKQAFGYAEPNYDPVALAIELVSLRPNAQLIRLYFYTGIHSYRKDPKWNVFWNNKLRAIRREGDIRLGRGNTITYSRPLIYHDEVARDNAGNVVLNSSDGTAKVVPKGREKGIDLRLGLDVVRLANTRDYDVAMVVSQDTDYTEVVEEVEFISTQQKRRIAVVSASPRNAKGKFGIPFTAGIEITKVIYDRCLDPHTPSYYPSRPGPLFPP